MVASVALVLRGCGGALGAPETRRTWAFARARERAIGGAVVPSFNLGTHTDGAVGMGEVKAGRADGRFARGEGCCLRVGKATSVCVT